MNAYFEDASSIDYSLTQKYPFYCFVNNTLSNDFPMLPHWHYYVELLYATKGHGKVYLDGQSIELKKGDLLFVLPRDVHSIYLIDNDDFAYLVIKFDPDLLFNSKREAFVFKYLLQLLTPISSDLKHMTASDLPISYEADMPLLIELFQNKPNKFEWLVLSQLYRIMHHYANHLLSHGINFMQSTLPNEDISNILPSIEYIGAHFQEPLTAKLVADHCHLSYSYFSRQFKKITGISFTQYVNFIRITEAEKLLLEKQDSVTSIGFKVGFTDTSYFIKQFKLFKKMTPKTFAKLVKDNF